MDYGELMLFALSYANKRRNQLIRFSPHCRCHSFWSLIFPCLEGLGFCIAFLKSTLVSWHESFFGNDMEKVWSMPFCALFVWQRWNLWIFDGMGGARVHLVVSFFFVPLSFHVVGSFVVHAYFPSLGSFPHFVSWL